MDFPIFNENETENYTSILYLALKMKIMKIMKISLFSNKISFFIEFQSNNIAFLQMLVLPLI